MYHNSNIHTMLGLAEGMTMPLAWADASSLVSEEEIKALVYDTIDEELMAVGDQAAAMRANIRMWSRLQADKVAEIALKVMSVLTSGRWLSARAEQTTERLSESYYISSRDGVDDVERLLLLMDSEIMESLPFVDEMLDLRMFVTEVMAKLKVKLKRLWQTAVSERPLSMIYETKWVKSWKDDVLSPTKQDIRDYEAEVERMLAIDDTETREGVLSIAIDYVEEAIRDNRWGEIYLRLREDPRQLVKAISKERFNEGGSELDQLRQLARKYEWLTSEKKMLESQEAPVQSMVVINQPSSVSINDIHDNNNVTMPH